MSKISKTKQNKTDQALPVMKEGKLRIGRSIKKMTDYKQAIAIGLAEAREEETRFRNKRR